MRTVRTLIKLGTIANHLLRYMHEDLFVPVYLYSVAQLSTKI